MGSDWWMFDEYVKEAVLEDIETFGKYPKKAYISDNWSVAKRIIKEKFPDCEIIDVLSGCDGGKFDFRLE